MGHANWANDHSMLVKIGTVVFFYLKATATVGAATWATIATLPAGYRPTANTYLSAQVTFASDSKWRGMVGVVKAADGVAYAVSYDNGTDWGTAMPAIATGDVVTMFGFFVAA